MIALIVIVLVPQCDPTPGSPGSVVGQIDLTNETIHALTGSPPTLAILPFEVLGNASQQLYLARGLAADLTAYLSALSGLTVIGTSPIGTAPTDGRPPLSAAHYRLRGGVRHENERLLLRLAMIETTSGEQIWSKLYDRPFDELASLAGESASALADALAIRVTETEKRHLARRATYSAEAYALFLRAQAALLMRRPVENLQARELYLEALSIDPTFVRALGGIALTYAADYRNRWSANGEEALTRAKKTAQEAARMNPDLPEVLWVLAYVHVRDGNHQLALDYLDRTLALEPSFADAYALKAGVMTYLGSPEEAVPLLSRAMRLNPRAGYLYYLILGRALFYLGEEDQATSNLREAVSRNPDNLEAHLYLAAALANIGEVEGWEWEMLEIENLEPVFSLFQWLETHPTQDPEQTKRLISALQKKP